MLTPISPPPGVVVKGTELDSRGRWRDARFIRWVEGVMQPIGWWRRITQDPLPGRICGMQPLRDNAQRRSLVIGTSTHAFVLFDSEYLDITPDAFVEDRDVTAIGDGYGTSEYGEYDYGTARPTPLTGIILEANNWSLDVWGEFVVGVAVSDGRALVWRPGDLRTAPDSKFNVIANAPEGNRALLVTKERHLMLIAADGDPRKIQWSAREDYTEWTPTALNLAGDLRLETKGTLQVGLYAGGDILLLSDVDAFRVRYTGRPFGYGARQVGTNCGVLGPDAAASTNDFVVWMSSDGFFLYNGQITPLPCEVWDYVYRNLNRNQAALITAGHNSNHSEVWWFFPVGDEAVNSRYVIWNYREDWWSVGELSRSRWTPQGPWPHMLAATAEGHVYEHELSPLSVGVQTRPEPFVQSSPMLIGQGGDSVVVANTMVTDDGLDGQNFLRYDVDVRPNPETGWTPHGPYYPNAAGYTDVRFTGREVRLRVSAEEAKDWRLGVVRIDIKPGGRR